MVEQVLTTGAAARELGISPETLRHHERRGNIPSVSRAAGVNGPRLYAAGDIERLKAWRAEMEAKRPKRGA